MNDTKELFACPCCNYLSLSERGQYEICLVCFWEDDGTQSPDDYSMPNRLFLVKGQENFLKLGACDERAVLLVKKNAKSHYSKQHFSELNQNSSTIHANPFARFLKNKILR
jgi:hypothetical protein